MKRAHGGLGEHGMARRRGRRRCRGGGQGREPHLEGGLVHDSAAVDVAAELALHLRLELDVTEVHDGGDELVDLVSLLREGHRGRCIVQSGQGGLWAQTIFGRRYAM